MRNKETRKATKTDEIPQSNLLLSRALIKSLGWSWPPLTGKTVGQCLPQGVIITFRSLDRALQRSLLNFGQQVLRDDITQEEKEKLYRLSWDIRRLLIDTLALIHTPEGFDPSADQFWYFDGSSELIWLRLNPGRLESQESTKEIDYPTSITFSTTHPLEGSGIHPCHPRAEKRTIDVCQAPSEGYWLLGFQDCCNPFHHINFSRLQRFASVRISPHVNTLGMLWLENGRPGPKNRILFQKTASEEDLAMFLWPQFQSLHYKALEKLPETPKIPIFQDDVVEICNEDRLLLFTTCYRSHRVHISLQLTIKFHWASEDKQQAKLKNWSSNCELWPNPAERYSHYIKRPLIYPSSIETDILSETTDGSRKGLQLVQIPNEIKSEKNVHENVTALNQDGDYISNDENTVCDDINYDVVGSFEKPDPEAEKVEIENQNSIKQSSRLKSASKQSAITRSEKLATSSPIQPAKTTTANSALIEAPKENTIETTTKPPTASRKRGRPKDSLKESSKSNETIKLRKSTRLEECSNNKATRDEGVTRRKTITSAEAPEVDGKRKINPPRRENLSSGTNSTDYNSAHPCCTSTNSSTSSSFSSTCRKSSLRRLR